MIFDYDQRLTMLAGHTVQLTSIEYELLTELSANSDRVVSYGRLLRRVRRQRGSRDSRPVRTIVENLRRKLDDDANDSTYILTEPRVSYRMPKVGGRNARRSDRHPSPTGQ